MSLNVLVAYYCWYNDGTWMTIHTQNWLGNHTFFVISILHARSVKTVKLRRGMQDPTDKTVGRLYVHVWARIRGPRHRFRANKTKFAHPVNRYRLRHWPVQRYPRGSEWFDVHFRKHLHIGLFTPPLVPLSLMYSRANISPVWRVLLQDKDVMLKSHNILKLVDFHCTCAREWIAHTAHGRKMEGF